MVDENPAVLASGGRVEQRARFAALLSGSQRRDSIVALEYSSTFRYLFYTSIVVALLWPKYFYVNIPGLLGLSFFVIYALLFAIIGVPIALARAGAMPSLRQVVQRSYILAALALAFELWRGITSFIAMPVLSEVPWLVYLRSVPQVFVYFIIGLAFAVDRTAYRGIHKTIIIMIFVIAFGAIVEVTSNLRLLKLLGLSELAAGGRLVESFYSNFFRDGALRVQSTFTQPLVFGQFCAAISPLCLALAFSGERRWRIPSWIAYALCIYCVYLSTSRSALLILPIANAVFLLLAVIGRFQYRWLMLAVSAVLLAFAILTSFQLSETVAQLAGEGKDNQRSLQMREEMVDRSLTRAAIAPIGGYGNGSAKWLAGHVDDAGASATIDSLFLTLLVENGYVGVILWTLMMIVLLLMAVRNAMEGASIYVRLVNAAMASFVAAMLVGFSVLSIEDNMIFIYLFAGLVMVDRLSTRSVSGIGRVLF